MKVECHLVANMGLGAGYTLVITRTGEERVGYVQRVQRVETSLDGVDVDELIAKLEPLAKGMWVNHPVFGKPCPQPDVPPTMYRAECGCGWWLACTSIEGMETARAAHMATCKVASCPAKPVAIPLPYKDGTPQDIQSRYDELIMAVGRVFPGETRYQTALRYIREAEARAVPGTMTILPYPVGKVGTE